MNMETFMGPDPTVGASLMPQQQQQLPPSQKFKMPERFNFSGGMPQPPMGAPMGQPQQAQQPMGGMMGMNPQLFQQLFAAFLNRPQAAPRQPIAPPPSSMPSAQPQMAASTEAFRNAAGEFDPWEGMGAPPQALAFGQEATEDPKYAAIRARQRARQAEIEYFSPKPAYYNPGN